MSSRDEYIRKMQAKLEEWNTEIDSLTVKASEVSADVRSEYNEQIASLKAICSWQPGRRLMSFNIPGKVPGKI